MSNEPAFVIGIDFGTTYTGACYALASQNTEKPTIEEIISWPGAAKALYPKTPTVSIYKISEEGNFSLEKWGAKAQTAVLKESSSVRFSRFKLLLDKESGAENEFSDDLPLDRIIADYLQKVVNLVKRDIDRKYPQFSRSPNAFRYCLTIPAMWDDAAKSIMRKAAIRAELISESDPPERLILTSEPEAAALDCENSQTANSLEDEDVIFICDAGGGTIDLTVYKVHYEENGKKCFEELTRGQGKSCGSSYIDDLARLWFKGHLEGIMGINSLSSNDLDAMTLNFSTEQKAEFGSIEKDEDDDEDDDDDDDEEEEDVYVNIPTGIARHLDDAESNYISSGSKFKITHAEMKGFLFDPIIEEVLKLIDEQLNRISHINPEKIKLFLVGGFGQSKYLSKRISETFYDAKRIKFLFVPSGGGLSIARGAVLYGLKPTMITHRVSRRSYGVRCNRSFREGIDKNEYLIVGRDGKKRCKNRMDFFVKKNTQIESTFCVERDYYAFYPDNPNSVLYAYDGDDNPPDYVTDEGIKKIAKLNIIMPKLPGKQPNEKIRYKTKIYLGQTEIQFEVEICGKTQIYRASLDENDVSEDAQAKPKKKRKSPGFENIINHFNSLNYKQTNRYKDRAKVSSEVVSKPKSKSKTNSKTKTKQTGTINNGGSQAPQVGNARVNSSRNNASSFNNQESSFFDSTIVGNGNKPEILHQ